MIRLLLYVALVLTSLHTHAQNISGGSVLSDTTIAVGVIKEGSSISKTVPEYCSQEFGSPAESNLTIYICGAYSCDNSTFKRKTDYYEVVLNGQVHYVKREDVRTYESYWEQIKSMDPAKRENFYNFAVQVGKATHLLEVEKAIKFIDNTALKGLTIWGYSIYDESEYTEGTGFKIKVYNPTKKTIKYLWFSVVGYNPVKDKVIERRTGSTTITQKGVGPIEPGESGTYDFTYTWFTDLVQTVKITSIKVQYMDGTFKTILNPTSSILLSEKDRALIEEVE